MIKKAREYIWDGSVFWYNIRLVKWLDITALNKVGDFLSWYVVVFHYTPLAYQMLGYTYDLTICYLLQI